MIRTLLTLWTVLGVYGITFAQTSDPGFWFEKLQPEVEEMVEYEIPARENATFLEMDFASAVIRNPTAWQGDGRHIAQVDLILTRYPFDLDSWEIGYGTLMETRFRNLMQLVPELTQNDNVHWRVVLQTAGRDLKAARKMAHGFVLHTSPPLPDSLPALTSEEDSIRPPRFDTTDLRKNHDRVLRIFHSEETYHDSTAINVFVRNPDWEGMVVVADWTASMYRHGAQFIQWLLANRDRGSVRHFVLFNDGDAKYDDEKVIGSTGGIYATDDDTDEQLNAAMEAATMGGEGGDHRENDLEALLRGMELCPDCARLVLIADNSGPVRDLPLLIQIDKPVTIVLCGVYKEDIHPDYLTIAHFTGGSIHTRDQDYSDIAAMVQHRMLVLGENEYELKGKRFVKKRKY
jgi:hypothetical protein